MKKSILLSIFAFSILISKVSIAQTLIPNGGFEIFSVDQSNNFKEFSSWSSINFFNPTVSKSTDSHSGTTALKVYNANARGGQISTEIKLNGNYPTKLKGFVKYTVGNGEKVSIRVSKFKTTKSNGGFVKSFEPVGWKTFVGTTSTYLPFEIVLDYRLSNSLYFDKDILTDLSIEIYAYDSKKSDISSRITDKTFLLVDDLTFEGAINSIERFATGLPDGIENWSTMDNIVYPVGWVDGFGIDSAFISEVSKSSDAIEGEYALRLTNSKTKGDVSLFANKVFINTDPSKNLQISLKYSLSKGDNLVCILVEKGFTYYETVFKYFDDSQLTYRPTSINLSKFSKDSLIYMIMALKKVAADRTPIYVLIDDMKLVNKTLSLDNEFDNLSSFNLYPNPSTSGIFNFNTTNSEFIEIFDIHGLRLNSTSILNSEKGIVDLSQHPEGVYFLKSGIITKKLVYLH